MHTIIFLGTNKRKKIQRNHPKKTEESETQTLSIPSRRRPSSNYQTRPLPPSENGRRPAEKRGLDLETLILTCIVLFQPPGARSAAPSRAISAAASSSEFHRGQRSIAVRCGRDPLEESKNYYELLGVSVDSSPQEIKDAYRRLQKKYHPDIAGEKGHESTLILNKAYKVLMSNGLREEYDASIGRTRFGVDSSASGSVWRGPLRPHALFVDENACIVPRTLIFGI